MKKGLLNEIKAMNKIAGTQLTKEQEIAIIKNRLQELEFGTQKAFDTYKKDHDMRPDTKVKVAGKNTTVGQASKNSGSDKSNGKSVFGGKGGKVFGKKSDKKQHTDFAKKYAKTASLSGTAADADGASPKIDSDATQHYYRIKSGKNDLFMSRKQSKAVAKALRHGTDANIDSDQNDNDDKFPPVKVKKVKDNMVISTGGKEVKVSKKQAKELARDIKDSFF